jgi:hypothetical protein
MMDWEADKALKMSAHHVPLRQMTQTNWYVRWTGENRWNILEYVGRTHPVSKQLPKITVQKFTVAGNFFFSLI